MTFQLSDLLTLKLVRRTSSSQAGAAIGARVGAFLPWPRVSRAMVTHALLSWRKGNGLRSYRRTKNLLVFTFPFLHASNAKKPDLISSITTKAL